MFGDRFVRVAHQGLVVMLVVMSMVALTAQTVVDPRYVEFNASPDHDAFASDGTTPLVSGYSLSIYLQGSSVAFATVNVGKPTPGTGGIIRVDFLSLLTAIPTPGLAFEARVAAVGPGGSTASPLSNTFSYTAPCAPSISPTTQSILQSATSGTVFVTAGTGCAWSAASGAAWISLSGSTNGTGNGTVAYSISANSSTAQRVGTITIGGNSFTITQAGTTSACSYSLASTSQSVTAGAATGSTSVTAPTGCTWSSTSNASWIALTSGATGSGNGSVNFSVAANTAATPRTGTLTIAGQTYTVAQAALGCTYTLSPTSRSVSSSASTSTATLSAPTGCTWTATSNATSWLTVTGGATGNGNGVVTFNAAANSSTQARAGTLTIGGQTLTVSQASGSCAYAISPASRTMPPTAGTATLTVTTATSCPWSASVSASWVTVSESGPGSKTVTYSVSANSKTNQRTATITIGGQVHTITQSAGTRPVPPGRLRIVTATGGA
jgi:hypothetical protein